MIQATVIIAAWNSENTITASVESALAQSDVSLEIIVVDDQSTDKTRAVANELAAKYPQVCVVAQTQNGGPAAARNAAIAVATGAWIAVLDADDLFCPGRLAAMIRYGDRNGADVIFDAILMRAVGCKTDRAAVLAFDGDPEAGNWTLENYIAGNMHSGTGLSLGYLKPVIRRSFLTTHGLRYDESLRNGEDFHFILEALAHGAVVRFRAESGYIYAVGHDSVSHRLNSTHAATLARADLAFIARHEHALSHDSITMMQHRARSILNLASAEMALKALRQGNPVLASQALWRRPQATGRFFRQLGEAVRNRLARR